MPRPVKVVDKAEVGKTYYPNMPKTEVFCSTP